MASRSPSGKSKASLDPALPQKKRARRRLVGAAAVCLAAAIVLPLVLDSEPRQIRDDVQVRIPSRDTPLPERVAPDVRSGVIKPMTGDQAAVAPQGADRDGAGQSAARGGQDAGDDARNGKSDASGAGAAAVAEPAPRDASPAAAKTTPKPAASAPADDPIGRLAQAKDAPSAKGTGDAGTDAYLVQIGAFSSAKGATEQVERAGKAGYKAFTEKITTAQGERIRVRVGPFRTREAAEQARTKLRAAGLESVLVAP